MAKFDDPSLERRKKLVESTSGEIPLRFDEVVSTYRIHRNTLFNDLKFLRTLGINLRVVDGYIVNPDPDAKRLIREITFPPEYRDAGVAILAYFAKVLEEKCPEAGARVSIVQEGNTVRLQIQSDSGHLQTVERTLEEYGRVVRGEIEPRQFLSDPAAATDLTNKLEITRLELRLKEQSFLQYRDITEKRIVNLDDQVKTLMNMMGDQLTAVQSLAQSLERLAAAERLSPAAAKAMSELTRLAASERDSASEARLLSALKILQRESPSLSQRIQTSASNLAHSIAGNLATPWVVAAINAMPK